MTIYDLNHKLKKLIINKRLLTSQRSIQGHIVHNSLDFSKKNGVTGGFWHGKSKRGLCATVERRVLLANPDWHAHCYVGTH